MPADKKDKKKEPRPAGITIIRRPKKVVGGHHGGAWKVAYADFVTAMMSFFLLLWLLSVTTNEQKHRIADYFSPSNERISMDRNGANGVLGGQTLGSEGAKTNESLDPQRADSPEDEEDDKANPQSSADAAADKADEKSLQEAEENLKQAIESTPELKDFLPNLLLDMTPEGLRIQIVDTKNRPMFQIGSAVPLPQTIELLGLVTKVIMPLPNKLSIRGHTDATPYGKDAAYTNWELSADRANASRRVMLGAGFETGRVENVQGKADRELLDAKDPASARNRRVSIIVLKQSVAGGIKRAAQPVKKGGGGAPPEPKKHEEGVIYFP